MPGYPKPASNPARMLLLTRKLAAHLHWRLSTNRQSSRTASSSAKGMGTCRLHVCLALVPTPYGGLFGFLIRRETYYLGTMLGVLFCEKPPYETSGRWEANFWQDEKPHGMMHITTCGGRVGPRSTVQALTLSLVSKHNSTYVI